mmetsp:Transcript_90633/g.233975  ORF Transcript_90633/g.233975 Transcript_90633/m.233975 type:complete len:285 (+) Transcript_90633:1333-2187(+)
MSLSPLSLSQTGSFSSSCSSPAIMGGTSLLTFSFGKGGARPPPRSRTGTPTRGRSVKRMPILPGFSRVGGTYSSVSSRSSFVQIVSCFLDMPSCTVVVRTGSVRGAGSSASAGISSSSGTSSVTSVTSGPSGASRSSSSSPGRRGRHSAGFSAAMPSSSKLAYMSSSHFRFSSCSQCSICSRFSRSNRHCSCSPAFSFSCFTSSLFCKRACSRSAAAARACCRRSRSSALVPDARNSCQRPGSLFRSVSVTLSEPTRQRVFGCSGSISCRRSASNSDGWQLTLM